MIRRDRARAALLVATALATAPFTASATAATRPQETAAGAQELPPELNQALTLAGGGDLTGAIAIVEALCAQPGTPEAAFAMLGGLHVEAGNLERAMEVLGPLTTRDPADPAVLYNAGRAAEGLGRFQDANTFYRRSLAIQPGSPALRSLGMMIGRLGQPEVAYEFLGPWTRVNPSDTEARMAAAAGAIALERAPEADALLDGLPGNDPGVKLLRAQVLLQRADPWGAINQLRLLEAEPPPALDSAFRRTLARAYLVVGEAEGALAQMEPLEGGGPDDAVILASAYFQAGRLEDAVQTLAPHAELLLGESPSTPRPAAAGQMALEYGRYLHSAGEALRAIPFLRLATELDPETPAAFQALGQAFAAAGERDLAREALDRFQDLSQAAANEIVVLDRRQRDVDDPTGRVVREALQQAGAGDVEAALEKLRSESGLAPDDPRPAYAASSILLHAGRPEEALALADHALIVAPQGADGLYQRGAVLMSLQRLTEAERMFRQALAASQDHIATLSDYAVLLMSQGRNDEALRHLERVLELRPGDTLARQHLDRLQGGAEPAEPATVEDWARIGREFVRDQNYKAAEEPLRR
ncbi:MAG: tetratricopeptide repeat protein, partial [Acidobacteria bacterium]|nr:tetratricopeptide repeat protein [Acidobacteriota bacterium]